jgi:hypothetical protein
VKTAAARGGHPLQGAQFALGVGVLQALRASLIGFIPIALATLVAWAAGGSGGGKSADAIHGASWIWLAAHHVGFDLRLPPTDVSGRLWLLPLGLSVIPWFVLRDSGRRITASLSLQQRRPALLGLTFAYSLAVAASAKLSTTKAVAPEIWAAFLSGFLFALICGAIGIYGLRNLISPLAGKLSNRAKSLLRGIALTSVILYGSSFLLLTIAIITHWSRFISLFTVLDPGWIGLLLLLLLTFASLPNAAVMTTSLVAGAGFAIGNQTLISPWRVRMAELPAFPLLAPLPTGRSLFLDLLPIVAILASAVGGFIAVKSIAGRYAKLYTCGAHAAANAGLLLTFNILAGGSLVGGHLSSVGASPVRVLVVALPIMFAGSLIGGIAASVSQLGSKNEDAQFER